MPKRKKTVIGVTGSFGSGKSTVTEMLQRLGARIIDADELAHAVILPGNPAYKKIVRACPLTGFPFWYR